jgi:hypothetical protein
VVGLRAIKQCRRTSFDAKQWPLLFLCRRMTGAEPWLSLNSNWTVGPQADTVTMAILPGIGIIVVFLLMTATIALDRQGFNHLLRYRDRTNPI